MKPMILVVDDHHASAESLCQYLRLRNFHADDASSTASAKVLMQSLIAGEVPSYGLVIVDFYMTDGVNGLDLIRWSRKEGVTCPFIILTGAPPYRMEEVRQAIDGEHLGPVAILIKPMDPDNLVMHIEALTPEPPE